MRSCWIIATILLVVPSASPSAQESHVDTRQGIEAMARDFGEHYNKGDAAAIARMFTKDAVRVSSESVAVSAGAQAIEQSFQAQFTTGFSHVDLTVDRVSTLGTDAAVSVGKYHFTGQGRSGPLMLDGNWTGVEVREGGAWKIRLLTLAATNVAPSGLEADSGSAAPEPNSEPTAIAPEGKKATLLVNIDKSKQKMTVVRDGVEAYQWPVSTGRGGYSTPSGTYTATSMNEVWYSKEWDNAPMPHSIFFMKDGHAIHGSNDVNDLGKPVSHGCVRISPANAATLYRLVKENGLDSTQVVLSGVTPGGEYKVGAASAGHHVQPPPKRREVQVAPNRRDLQAASNRREQGAYDAQPQTRTVPVERSFLAPRYAAPQGYYAGSWPYVRW